MGNKDVLVVQNDEFNQAQDRSSAMKRRKSVSMFAGGGRAMLLLINLVGSGGNTMALKRGSRWQSQQKSRFRGCARGGGR